MISSHANVLKKKLSVLVMGTRGLAQIAAKKCEEAGHKAVVYLTRDSGSFGPSLYASEMFDFRKESNPLPIIQSNQSNLVMPMSIDWHRQPWTEQVLDTGVRIFSPQGEGMRLERERAYGMQLARERDIPVPNWYVANDANDAQECFRQIPEAWVLKNPFCSPNAPLHTIVCRTAEETEHAIAELGQRDREGVFMQQFRGTVEIGHIALVANGEVIPWVTNQEYKWSDAGNNGTILGTPLGGIVQADPNDQYGLARRLIMPLSDWLSAVRFCGPLQVTAAWFDGKWQLLEYNVRIGVTTGPLAMEMMLDPIETFHQIASGKSTKPRFVDDRMYGMMLAGIASNSEIGTLLPESIAKSTNILWGDVVWDSSAGRLRIEGERPLDFVTFGNSIDDCNCRLQELKEKWSDVGLAYRDDVGKCLWPPGCP